MLAKSFCGLRSISLHHLTAQFCNSASRLKVPSELTIQFLDFRHQVVREKIGNNVSLSQPPLATSGDSRVGIEHTNYDPRNFTLDESFGARNLRMVAGSADLP